MGFRYSHNFHRRPRTEGNPSTWSQCLCEQIMSDTSGSLACAASRRVEARTGIMDISAKQSLFRSTTALLWGLTVYTATLQIRIHSAIAVLTKTYPSKEWIKRIHQNQHFQSPFTYSSTPAKDFPRWHSVVSYPTSQSPFVPTGWVVVEAGTETGDEYARISIRLADRHLKQTKSTADHTHPLLECRTKGLWPSSSIMNQNYPSWVKSPGIKIGKGVK